MNLIFLFILLMLSSCVDKEKFVNIGKKAPELAVLDTEDYAVKLNTLSQKIVLINFWSEGCSACVEEMPKYNKLYETYKNQMTIIGINIGSKKEDVIKVKKRLQIKYPLVLDPLYITKERYQIKSVPTLFVLDGQRKIIQRFDGKHDEKVLVRLINSLVQL